MAYSTDIFDLIKTESNARDAEWEKAFLNSLPTAKLRILSEAPQSGPDGWPYMLAEIDPNGTEPAAKVLTWLSDKGIGLALNPQNETPDYVLTYGMIWNFRERGVFLSANLVDTPMGEIKFSEGQKIHAGPPSSEYLPDYARMILRSFFHDNKVEKMNILVMSPDQKNYDLCFSLEAAGLPEKEEQQEILEAISWFLPAHYSLVLVSEKGLPQFHPL